MLTDCSKPHWQFLEGPVERRPDISLCTMNNSGYLIGIFQSEKSVQSLPVRQNSRCFGSGFCGASEKISRSASVFAGVFELGSRFSLRNIRLGVPTKGFGSPSNPSTVVTSLPSS